MPNAADRNKASSDIEHVDWSGSGQNYTNVRFGSASSQASQSSGDICRICHCESDPQNPLLTPCYCSGSLKYVHQACLQQWLTASETNACELCKFPFIMHTKIKPFNEWRSLDISGIERRRLCCSLLFHCAAALCVIWSLCVLIERAADDVQRGMIDWPFWTKLAVVTVGMTGGIVFMYIQCKAYLHLCHRWKARNRILLIQNAPEKIHPLTPPSPIAQCHARRGETRASDRDCDRDRDRSSACASTALEIPDNMASVSSIGGEYSYARESIGIRMDSDIEEGRDGPNSARCHHNMLYSSSRLAHSPNHMLPNSDLDADSLATQASSSSAVGMHANALHHGHHQLLGSHQHPLGQVAVAANIECTHSQHNYERDWALDDVVSQISSFRPCQQGSGSMTPFHDSIHNVLEHSEECSSRGSRQNLSTGGVSSDMGRDLTMQLSSFSGSGEHKPSSIGSGVSSAVANGLGGFVYKPHNKRYSNSSIFIENGDALNDDDVVVAGLEIAGDNYPKISFSHSSIPTSSSDSSMAAKTGIIGHSCSDVSAGSENLENEQLEEFLRRDKRRYSDTKLIGSMTLNHPDAEAREPMLSTCVDAPENAATMAISPSTSPQRQQQQQDIESHNQRRSKQDIEIAEEATTTSNRQTRSSSGHSRATTSECENARIHFKSLPNLSSSAESLLKK